MITPVSRTASEPRNVARAAWLILAVLLLFSIAAPLNQFKVPPIMPVLMSALGVSAAGAGLLMSVYAVTGLILALPAGFIFQKAGYRATGLLAGGSIVLGAGLGALSQGVGGLLAGRVIEGIGTSFMAVLAPAIIAQWFVTQRRGTAMGIWAAWVPVGSTAMLIMAPGLAQTGSWRTVWWFGACYAVVVTALYLIFVRPPAPNAAMAPSHPAVGARAEDVNAAHVLRNRDIWLVATAFGAFNAAVIGFATYMPTFLATQRGLSLNQAALVASIPTLITIFSAPGGGILSDRIGSRKKPYLVGLALAAVLLPLTGAVRGGALLSLVTISGLVLGLVPTNIFAAAVEATGDERQGGMAMAVVMVGQNAGMLIGPIIFGALVDSAVGWPAAFASLSLMALLGLLAGWLARTR